MQRWLEQVRRVERTARSRSGADQGMDFVDEQDRLGVVAQLLEHPLEPLLKIAAVFGAGQQSAHVERIDLGVLQHLGNLALCDAVGKPLGNCSLAHARLADKQRVVLAATA